jgi:transposase-like protein
VGWCRSEDPAEACPSPAPEKFPEGVLRVPISTADAAHIYGVKATTLRAWISKGRLRRLPGGMVDAVEVERLAAAYRPRG